MKITIAHRLRPFSTRPGTYCLIPGSTLAAKIYPSLIRLYDLKGPSPELIHEIVLDVQGPLKLFTVFQDLERGCLTVSGEKLFYHILPTGTIVTTKNPHTPPLPSLERLSLGIHKKQNWEGIYQRMDFREIFPLWLRLGLLLPEITTQRNREGMFQLVDACEEVIAKNRPETVLDCFYKLFLAGFEGMMVPRFEDTDYQGILPFGVSTAPYCALPLLSEGARLIRSLFVKVVDEGISFLPHLPPEFASGRMTNIHCHPFAEIDLEWTKKQMRSCMIRPLREEGTFKLFLSSSLRRYRVRRHLKEKGTFLRSGEEVPLDQGPLLIDRFE